MVSLILVRRSGRAVWLDSETSDVDDLKIKDLASKPPSSVVTLTLSILY